MKRRLSVQIVLAGVALVALLSMVPAIFPFAPARDKASEPDFTDSQLDFFRTQVQPRTFEARLRANNVPYVLVGGQSFFDRKEVRDLLSFLKCVANPEDEVSLLRIINTPPRGIGKTTIDRINAWATEQGVSAAAAFRRLDEIPGLPPAAVAGAQRLREAFERLSAQTDGEGLVTLVQKLLHDVGYKEEVERTYPDAAAREARWAGVMEVVNFAENYARRNASPDLLGFLEELSLSANDDKTSEDPRRRNAVTLMTLHAAKGLEFPNVYLVGCEEGLIPHARSIEEDTIDEERRLMYVGITRAQERLIVTHAAERAKYGKRIECTPSRFLFELLAGDDELESRDGELPDSLPDKHEKILLARHGQASPVGPPRKEPPKPTGSGPFSKRKFRGGGKA